MPLLSSTQSCQACIVCLKAASLHVCVFSPYRGSEVKLVWTLRIKWRWLWQFAVLQGLTNVSENLSNLCDSLILHSNFRRVVLWWRKWNWKVCGLGNFGGKVSFTFFNGRNFLSSKLIHFILFINYLWHKFMLDSIEVPSSRLPWRLNNASARERPACIKF
jgi:hypothetical protein